MSRTTDDPISRSVAGGRKALGTALSAAQVHLQKVFIVFLVGFVGTIYGLWAFGWDILKADLLSQAPEADVIAVTPFDVILLQVKIGLVVGIVLALPALAYFSRDALERRGVWPTLDARWKAAGLGGLAVLLFLVGVGYAYAFLFPLLFEFFASNAAAVGFEPSYSIVKWAQFVILLSLAMGIAAELPLVMSALAYTGTVPHDTFREKWRHAVVVIAVIASIVNGSPDPISMSIVAAPMVLLYGVGLVFTKAITGARRGTTSPRRVLAARWPRLVGVAALASLLVAGASAAGVWIALYDALLRPIGLVRIPYVGEVFGVARPVAVVLLGIVVFVLAFAAALAYAIVTATPDPAASAVATPGVGGPSVGDPAAIDLDDLDAGGVRAAPPEVFAEMSEQEALARAQSAIDADRPEKAQAILDRFEEPGAQTTLEESADEDTGTPASVETDTDAESVTASEDANVVTRTTAGMVDAFTAEETTEEDIGGYYYDLTFVLSTLRSRSFRLIGLFTLVLVGTFMGLYRGGIGIIRADFLARLPESLVGEVDIVALHPVEALIFEVKISTLFAVLSVLPFGLYYAWPALKERGLAGGDRRVLLVWAGTLFAGLVAGTALGYTVVAPRLISWLAVDALNSDMLIKYRISSAGWLVFLTTVGVGVLGTIPVSMVLFHRGGIVSYGGLFERWREVTVGVFAATGLLSPRGVFMMFILGLPVLAAYSLGLGIVYLYTLGGRRRTHSAYESVD